MTYSIHTLTDGGSAQPHRPGVGRFAHEIVLVLGFAVLAFWLLALVSYSAQDPAFSTSGAGVPIRNWGGKMGAWLADGTYFMLGFSAWWCFAAGVRAWLGTLARWMRAGASPEDDVDHPILRARWAFWVGFAVLLCASTALEWSRLY